MDHFLEEIDNIQEQQQKLTEYNQHLYKLIVDSKNKNEILILTNIFEETSKKIKIDILNLNKTIETNDSFYKTKQTQYRNIIRRFYEELNTFKEIQLKEKEIEEMKLKEDYLIAYPESTEKDFKEFIKNGKENCSVFQESGFLNKKILERHELIKHLSQDVIKIVKLIDEIKEIVEERKIDVEMIEIDFEKTEKNTKQVNTNLKGALKKQKLKNKVWKWIVCLIGIIGVFLLLYLCIKLLWNYFTKS